MTQVFDCADEQQREAGFAAAQEALADGQLVVLPTDTVYGLAADAFSASGVDRIFEAKDRGRQMPPPVLVPNPRTVDGLAMAMPSYVRRLIKEFWPGALTIVLRAQQSLSWDLGDTNGTVGLRMPDDEVTLALLAETGPLAVSSANRTGKPAATTVTEAGFMLGPYVDVYLDAGTRPEGTPSTIIDCTKPDPVVLREGAISVDRLREVLGDLEIVSPADLESGDEPDSGEHGDDHGLEQSLDEPVGDELPQVDQEPARPAADDPDPDLDPDPTSNER